MFQIAFKLQILQLLLESLPRIIPANEIGNFFTRKGLYKIKNCIFGVKNASRSPNEIRRR